MASNDAIPEDPDRQRLRELVETQLWNSVPHHYVVGAPKTLPAGSGVTFWDADGRVSGAAPDGRPIDPEGVGWVLTKPPEPEEPTETPEPTLTDRERFDEQANIERWRRQFTDQKMKDRAQNALIKRRAYQRSHPVVGRPRRPRKYSDQGALLEFTNKEGSSDAP